MRGDQASRGERCEGSRIVRLSEEKASVDL